MNIVDHAVNDQTPGPDTQVTFQLVDNENRAAGRDIYIAGKFNNWNYDEFSEDKLTKTGPNTYSITKTVPGYYTAYRYFVWVPDPQNPTSNIADKTIFTADDIYARIVGTGTPPAITIVNVIGRPPVVRILKVAAGLEAAPTTPGELQALDADGDNAITLLDAVKKLRP